MRGLCGWFSDRPEDDAGSTLRRMLAASHPPALDAELKTRPQAGLAVFGGAARPTLLEQDGFVLAVLGHPRLRDKPPQGAGLHELARALRARGKAVLSDIGGDFALACWDDEKQRGLLAIDRIGMHQLPHSSVYRLPPSLRSAGGEPWLAGSSGTRGVRSRTPRASPAVPAGTCGATGASGETCPA